MSEPDLALLLTGLACLVLRLAGVLLAGRLRADHPFIAWASSVAQATLAVFVVLAVLAPTGALAQLPLHARLVGLGVGVAAYFLLRERLLPALAIGLVAVVLVG
ncbi:AzlD domain-containing protein [Plastoroseomonas arctica]|uniref:AzlD domain-containing protein n=1 Tax=Plastoroseomonas arctica TaxID=1509237 RepID=A0AAF1KQC3_9PROT|nr:AzlD domain-containing protein [Plastoroseomonas arctica]MBR0657433.1 AzlD domain-containing protein [Plastoroseomonas arctica]